MKRHIDKALFTAVATPITSNGAIDLDRYLDHCDWVLRSGSHGLCPFGTTGEGVNFSATATRLAIDTLARRFGAKALMPVIGVCDIETAVTLCSHSVRAGCRGVLLMPPFYYKRPPDEGVRSFYARVIENVNDTRLRLFVYNIPQLTAVPISQELVRKLVDDFGDIIAGIKDSAGALSNTLGYITAFPALSVMSGTDAHIIPTVVKGGSGTVTGMGNINSKALRSALDGLSEIEGAAAGHLHSIVERFGGVPAMKAVIAHYRGDGAWRAMTPPLVSLAEARAIQLINELREHGHRWAS